MGIREWVCEGFGALISIREIEGFVDATDEQLSGVGNVQIAFETDDGTLWVSTFKDGILGIKDKKVIYNFTTKSGLLSNQTGKLKSDKNQLWIITEQGVQVLDTKTKKINEECKFRFLSKSRLCN